MNEEIKQLPNIVDACLDDAILDEVRQNLNEKLNNVCKLAIKELEQEDVLDKIKTEIKEWYWQADKQALAKDPCIVDAMVDLFIRTIDKYKTEGSISKEEQIRKQQTKELINELSKMPSMVIATAYLHALNYTLYGKDVTEKWLTATQNARALDKAYAKGYYDALQRQTESEDAK